MEDYPGGMVQQTDNAKAVSKVEAGELPKHALTPLASNLHCCATNGLAHTQCKSQDISDSNILTTSISLNESVPFCVSSSVCFHDT